MPLLKTVLLNEIRTILRPYTYSGLSGWAWHLGYERRFIPQVEALLILLSHDEADLNTVAASLEQLEAVYMAQTPEAIERDYLPWYLEEIHKAVVRVLSRRLSDYGMYSVNGAGSANAVTFLTALRLPGRHALTKQVMFSQMEYLIAHEPAWMLEAYTEQFGAAGVVHFLDAAAGIFNGATLPVVRLLDFLKNCPMDVRIALMCGVGLLSGFTLLALVISNAPLRLEEYLLHMHTLPEASRRAALLYVNGQMHSCLVIAAWRNAQLLPRLLQEVLALEYTAGAEAFWRTTFKVLLKDSDINLGRGGWLKACDFLNVLMAHPDRRSIIPLLTMPLSDRGKVLSEHVIHYISRYAQILPDISLYAQTLYANLLLCLTDSAFNAVRARLLPVIFAKAYSNRRTAEILIVFIHCHPELHAEWLPVRIDGNQNLLHLAAQFVPQGMLALLKHLHALSPKLQEDFLAQRASVTNHTPIETYAVYSAAGFPELVTQLVEYLRGARLLSMSTSLTGRLTAPRSQGLFPSADAESTQGVWSGFDAIHTGLF